MARMAVEKTKRTPKQIIDQAIRENASGLRFRYGLMAVFVLIGSFVLIWGTVTGSGTTAIAGSLATALFLQPMREARQIGRENLAIRLLEVPLSQTENANEAAELLRRFFDNVFITKKRER